MLLYSALAFSRDCLPVGEILEAFDEPFHGLSLFVDLNGEHFRNSQSASILPQSVDGIEELFQTTTEFLFALGQLCDRTTFRSVNLQQKHVRGFRGLRGMQPISILREQCLTAACQTED